MVVVVQFLSLGERTRFAISASLILLLALALRLVGLNKGLWFDEYQAVYDFAGNSGFAQATSALRYDIHPPIYFWMLHAWRRLGGDSEPYLRLLTVAISMAWLGLTMRWLRAQGRTAALLAGLIIASAPFLLRYGQEIKNYALLLFFAISSFYFVSRFLRDPQRPWYPFLAGIALVAAVCTHMIAVFLPAAVLVFALASAKQSERIRRLTPLLVPVVALPLLAAFLLLRFYFLDVPEQGTWIPKASWSFFLGLARTFAGTGLFPRGWEGATWAVLATAFASAGFGNWLAGLPFFAAAAIYFAQAVAYSLLIRSVCIDRYFLPVLVLLIAGFSVQLSSVPYAVVRRVGIGCVCLMATIYSVQWVRVDAAVPVESWREFGNILPARIDPSTQVFLLPEYLRGIVQFYVPRLPPERIIAVPVGKFPQKSMPAPFSRAILVIRARTAPSARGFKELLAVVQGRIVRPGIVDVYFVGPVDSRQFDGLLKAAASVLGKPREFSQQGNVRVGHFELADSK